MTPQTVSARLSTAVLDHLVAPMRRALGITDERRAGPGKLQGTYGNPVGVRRDGLTCSGCQVHGSTVGGKNARFPCFPNR